MANLLSSPSQWQDQNLHSPPTVWDGTTYGYDFPTTTLTFEGLATSGDVLAFSIIDTADNSTFSVIVNGTTVANLVPITATSAAYSYNIPLAASVVFTYTVTNTCAGPPNITVTPAVVHDAPVAPDIFINCALNSTDNANTPQITLDGSPVVPSSLTITTSPTHGTASVSGVTILYTPNTGYSGTDTFHYKATVSGVDSNIATAYVTVNADCTELGRVTKANVSAYTRNRIHKSKVMAQEIRCLVANFNGALCKGRTIVTATWSVSNPMFVNLLQCQIGTNGRDTACLMQAQWRGASLVRCTALLDNGEQYTQYFELTINGYWFQGDVPLPQGPYTIVANA